MTRSGISTTFQNFIQNRIRGLVSAHARLHAPNCLLYYFLGSSSHIQPRHHHGIDAKYVKRRGSAQGCAFLESQNQNLTFTPILPQKTDILGPNFDDRQKTALTLVIH